MTEAKAFEAAAPRVEWALNTVVSTPAAVREERIHPLIVFALTFLWGEISEMNRELMFMSLWWVDVRSTYALTASTGQHVTSWRPGIIIYCNGPLCCAFLGLSKENETPLTEKLTEIRLIEASSETLRREAKASKTAVLWVKAEIEINWLSPNADRYLMTVSGSHAELYLGRGGLRL